MATRGVFLPQKRGGLVFKSLDSLTPAETEFHERTKGLLARTPEEREEYRALVEELLFPPINKGTV